MTLRSDVAALYVDPRGPYPGLVRDWYDADRDARTYAGELPVVAHPPCGPWGPMRHLCSRQDASLAPHALGVVRRCGGVLEHPRGSQLWVHERLPLPGELPDEFGGWTLEVQQVDFGHVARKKTWLYVVGRRPSDVRVTLPPREPTHWIAGSRSNKRGPIPPGIRSCSGQQRRLTPLAFARWLLDVAAATRPRPPGF